MDKTLAVLLEHFRDKRTQVAEAISSGSAKDYAEYRALCGEVRGLLIAELYIKDLAKNLEQDDD
jgi:hypothetical protein|tara:strand:- start:510 stop:701 length:192 start_codon:yes stop_codon:yes gene_type:complete